MHGCPSEVGEWRGARRWEKSMFPEEDEDTASTELRERMLDEPQMAAGDGRGHRDEGRLMQLDVTGWLPDLDEHIKEHGEVQRNGNAVGALWFPFSF